MDKTYAETVRLLLRVAPEVFASGLFAMKGGTAINLFARDMPRLSVDTDLAYTRWQEPRETALNAISREIGEIGNRLRRQGLEVRITTAPGLGESKLFINQGDVQVKVDVNLVFRGTVLPVATRSLVPVATEMFSAELELPILAEAELYGGKLVAALDRQHPRDLFDVAELYEAGGITDKMVECFVTYLAGHNRPIHEVLFATPKDIEQAFRTSFLGMTTNPVSVETLVAARESLLKELPARLTDKHRRFLLGLASATPDWTLLACPHAAELPALRWKLQNLERFKKMRPDAFERQVQTLESELR
jgi:predicted nucleotidyltransferase component of viral defense system